MARPSKLTPESQASIVEDVLHGATFSDACRKAGVAYDTFNGWMNQGKEASSGRFFEFYHKVMEADAQCGINMVRVIQSAAAKGDWKAALEWLKRRRRAEWGDAVDVTSAGEKIIITVKGLDDITED
jgi:hypothetical protein